MDIVFRADTITRPSTLSMTVYNDTTDALTESSDIGDVTTEPSGSSYSRATLTLDSSDFTIGTQNGEAHVDIADKDLDVSDSSQDVDACLILASFQSDRAGDGSATTHILWSMDLDQTYDLSQSTTFTLDGAGGTLS